MCIQRIMMMTFRLRTLIPILATMTLLAVGAPAQPGPPPARGSAPAVQPPDADGERQVRQRGRWVSPPGEELPPAVARAFRFTFEIVEDMERIAFQEAFLEGRIQRAREAEDLSERARQRHERIAELRREVILLEKEELLERVREGTQHAADSITEFLGREETPRTPPGTVERMERFRERLLAIHSAADDYPTLRAYMEELASSRWTPQGPPDRQDLRLERLNKEISHLRQRMERLQDELERFSETPDPPQPPTE